MDDFDKFSTKSSAESKLNNFILIEPTLKLLGIPFNNSVAKDVMDGKFSIIINLVYQLFIALENKKKSNTTTLSMQSMQAPAISRIREIESVLYQQRLKKATPRQSDLDLRDLIKKYQDHQHTMQLKAEKERILSADGHKDDTEKHRQTCINRSKFLRSEQAEQMRKIEAALVQIPKPPTNKTVEALQHQKKLKMQKEADLALKELDDFERKRRNIIYQDADDDSLSISREGSFSISDQGIVDDKVLTSGKHDKTTEDLLEYIKPSDNKEYVNRIRSRLESDKEARMSREKRRRKVLINCLKSQHQQDENERENMIAMRLMRQSQMERRIAVQLLQLRHEKNVIKSNRLEREHQYQERREKEFINSLEKERELIRQMNLINMDNLRAEQELYDMKKSQNKLAKYQKHYEMAERVVNDIVDLSCKISEFQVLTEGNIPPKLIRDWKLAFFNGVPIYDEIPEDKNVVEHLLDEQETVVIQDISVTIEPQSVQANSKIEMEKKLELLDEEDILEYKQLIGEWQLDDENIPSVDRKNNILDWIIDNLQQLSQPVDENAKLPVLPSFPIRAAVVGKCFSGKSLLVKNLVKNNRCVSIVPQDVIHEALLAVEENELIEIECPLPPVHTVDVQMNENSRLDEDKTENQVIDMNLNASSNDLGVSIVIDDDTVNKSVEYLEEFPIIVKKPSPRSVLGAKIKDELMNGNSISDQLLVDVIIEYISRIPEGTGWIIDDFPSTYQQAKLFEKGSTGYEEPNVKQTKKKNKKPIIETKESGLDALILLSTGDSDCLARAMTISESQLNNKSDVTTVTKDVIANLQKSMTNFADHWPKLSKFYSKINEKMIRTINSGHDVNPENVYLQAEILLEDIIKQKQMPEPLPEIIPLPPIEIEQIPVVELIVDDLKTQSDVEGSSKEVNVTIKSTDKKSKSSSRGSSAGSKSSAKKESSRKSRSKSKSESANSKVDKKSTKKEAPKKKDAIADKRKGSKGSKSSSKGSRTGSGKGKKSKNPVPPETLKVEEIPVIEIAQPQPGDFDWVYAEKPINQEISLALYQFWESLNGVYVENCKLVFREIRDDREEIIRYLHAIKTAFRKFLDRPDAKQEYLDQFQKNFNEIDDAWRDDEEVQQELHQRISDLKDQLLEISHENQEDALREIEKLKANHWIEDRTGLISNQYLNLMQSEFDRFQDIIRFLKDYYKSMVNVQLEEFKPDFFRLPLIEIPVPKEETLEPQELNTETSRVSLGNTAINPPTKKGAAKAPVKSQATEGQGAEDTKELTDEEIEAMFKTRIPLIDFRTPGPQITSAILTSIPATGKPTKGDKSTAAATIAKLIAGAKPDKKNDKSAETLIPPNDLDERLLFDALMSCYTVANAILELEISHTNQKDEAEKQPVNVVPEKGKADKKGKGGKKSRTPTPKKGSKDKTTTNTSRSRGASAKQNNKGKGKNTTAKDTAVIPVQDTEETEEEKRNKLFLEKAKVEYIAALQKEVAILRVNVKIIMNKGTSVIRDIKEKVDSVFQMCSTWISDKLLREDMSIKEMENVYRYHVEIKSSLKEKVELIDHKFYLLPQQADSVKKPPSVNLPLPLEPVDENCFTIAQLKSFYNLFQSITDIKFGTISIIDFIQFVNEFIMASDLKSFPSFISQCTHIESTVASIADAFSCDKEYANWRLFLLACSEPWPWPTQSDLLNILSEFKELDQHNSGFVTREQYDFIDLWFSIPSTPSSPMGNSETKIVDRMSEIKKLFFDIFKTGNIFTESQDLETGHRVECLNYEQMLFHFAIFCTNNFYSGIIRALSVTVGENIPHIPVSFKNIYLPLDEDAEIRPEIDEDVIIPLENMYKVLSFGHRKVLSVNDPLEQMDLEDSETERDTTLLRSLKAIYETVQETDDSVPTIHSLLKHEGLLEWFLGCQWFKHVDLRSFFVDSSDTFRISGE